MVEQGDLNYQLRKQHSQNDIYLQEMVGLLEQEGAPLFRSLERYVLYKVSTCQELRSGKQIRANPEPISAPTVATNSHQKTNMSNQ